MKKAILFAIPLLGACTDYDPQFLSTTCSNNNAINSSYSKADEVSSILNETVRSGVPGAVISVYSEEEGWWENAVGYAKIEEQLPMQTCHLQYLQSVTKTYHAVAIMKLVEEGKINLDKPFPNYLSHHLSSYIADSDKITVRMLLNHTSGIPDYNFSPTYVTRLLQHPEYEFTAEDYLKFVEDKPLSFTPGSSYSYRNINYVLLALIIDFIEGDHAEFLQEVIFNPLGLTNTYYRNDPGYLSYPNLPNSYWDRYGDGIIENASYLQRQNVKRLIGDDGIVTTPREAVLFLKGLMEGKILKPETVEEMLDWVSKDGKPRYGLGIAFKETNGMVAIGHDGGGIGAGCDLRYYPEKGIYVFTAINLGTVTDSPIHDKAGKSIEKMWEVLIKD